MSWKLTMDDITEYKAAFSLFDKDNEGKISVESTKKLIRSLGQNFSEEKLSFIVKDFEKEKRSVELFEFLDLMAKYRVKTEDNSKLLLAFKYFDKKNNGKIKFSEFSHTLSTLNEAFTKDEIRLLEDYASPYDGYFDYPDLLNMILEKK